MHRTHPMLRPAFWTALAGLLLGGFLAAGARAADVNPAAPKEAAAARGTVFTVSVGSSQRLSMKDKKKLIKKVLNPKENIALVTPIESEQHEVLVTGREAGITRITLVGMDDTEEIVEVLVQFDVEFLRTLLQRAVPTATLQLIPAATGAIIIAGNVAHTEDIDIVMRTAQGVVATPDRIINAMRVGGVVQVQLDVIVAFVSRTELRRMSFDFLDAGLHHNLSSTLGGALINPNLGSALTSKPAVGLGVANVVGSPNGAPANVFLGLFNDQQVFYGLLQALRNENLAKILAEPKLVTLSGRSATLLSGGQQAIPETAGLGTISVRFEPFGTQLSVLPIVLGNGKIHLEVNPEISNIDASVGTSIAGTVVPGRNTQSVHTTVEIEDGQTLAIGGLIQNTVTGSTTKVPCLGDLPFIGAAFSSKSFSENESELVVLVTPHVVDAMSCEQLPKMLPGQETRSPDDFELFLEGIMEAPRGAREVCSDGHYIPAYKNGPTADSFPCAGARCGKCSSGCSAGCGTATCTGLSGCANPAITPAKPGSKPVAATYSGGSSEGVMTNTFSHTSSQPSVLGGSADAAAVREGKPFVLPSIGDGDGTR